MYGYLIFVATVAFASCATAYKVNARAREWPVGMWFEREASWVKTVALVALIWSVGKSFFAYEWWSPLAVLFVGFIAGVFILNTLKWWTQTACVVGVPATFLLTALYIDESKPFGVLHALAS